MLQLRLVLERLTLVLMAVILVGGVFFAGAYFLREAVGWKHLLASQHILELLLFPILTVAAFAIPLINLAINHGITVHCALVGPAPLRAPVRRSVKELLARPLGPRDQLLLDGIGLSAHDEAQRAAERVLAPRDQQS